METPRSHSSPSGEASRVLPFLISVSPVVVTLLRNPLNIWYLDDDTLRSSADIVAEDARPIFQFEEEVCFKLNVAKCGVVPLGGSKDSSADHPGNCVRRYLDGGVCPEDSMYLYQRMESQER